MPDDDTLKLDDRVEPVRFVCCLICGSAYTRIRKPGEICGDLSHHKHLKTITPPCPGILVPYDYGYRDIFDRAHRVIWGIYAKNMGRRDA